VVQLDCNDLRGTSGAMEHAESEGSSQSILQARGREGNLGEDADALVSLQRQALTGLTAGGVVVGWDVLLALSLTKERFTGRDIMKVDSEEEEEDIVAVLYYEL
jgi:hypothetical protein